MSSKALGRAGLQACRGDQESLDPSMVRLGLSDMTCAKSIAFKPSQRPVHAISNPLPRRMLCMLHSSCYLGVEESLLLHQADSSLTLLLASWEK